MSHIKRLIEHESPAFLPCVDTKLNDHDHLSNQEFEYVHKLTCEEADRMLMAEGPWHVEERYYANAGDAEINRMLVAERRVRERIRQAKLDLNYTHVPKEYRRMA